METKTFAIIEIVLTILLILILIYFFVEERKGQKEVLEILKAIRDKK